jgi:hypothetical protein
MVALWAPDKRGESTVAVNHHGIDLLAGSSRRQIAT